MAFTFNARMDTVTCMMAVQVGKDQEKVQSEKDPKKIPKTEVGKNQTNNQVLIPRKQFVSRMSSYFPNR